MTANDERCPKCGYPLDRMERTYHAIGQCHEGYTGTEHVHWLCICGHRMVTYPERNRP